MPDERNFLIRPIALRFAQIQKPRLVVRPGRWRTVLAIVGFCMLLTGESTGQVPADSLLQSLRPSGDVNDFAGILTPQQKELLENRCNTLRQTTGAQFAVVTVKSLEGGQIDDFANKLFARWGVGEKGKNNGILLLVALQDRKARVEVGYGLEPVLPDALAGRVLDQELFPAFKQKRYFDGLNVSVTRICEIVQRGQPASAADRRVAGQPGMLVIAGFLSLFVAVGSFIAGVGIGKRVVPQILFGLLFVGVAFWIGCMMAAPLAPLIHTPLGLLMGFLGWRASSGSSRGTSSWTSGIPSPGWTWIDTSGGSWGSSDWSSGGGFSGGGGGFGGGSSGGGGASGGW